MALTRPRGFFEVPAPSALSWIRQILLKAFGLPPRREPPPSIDTLLHRLDERR